MKQLHWIIKAMFLMFVTSYQCYLLLFIIIQNLDNIVWMLCHRTPYLVAIKWLLQSFCTESSILIITMTEIFNWTLMSSCRYKVCMLFLHSPYNVTELRCESDTLLFLCNSSCVLNKQDCVVVMETLFCPTRIYLLNYSHGYKNVLGPVLEFCFAIGSFKN